MTFVFLIFELCHDSKANLTRFYWYWNPDLRSVLHVSFDIISDSEKLGKSTALFVAPPLKALLSRTDNAVMPPACESTLLDAGYDGIRRENMGNVVPALQVQISRYISR